MQNTSYSTSGYLVSPQYVKQQVLFEIKGGALTIYLEPCKTQIVYLPQGSMDTILNWFRHVDENQNIGTLDLDNPETKIRATFEVPLPNLVELEQLLRGRQVFFRKPTIKVVEPISQQIFRVSIEGTTQTFIEKMAFFPQNQMDFAQLSRLDQLRQEAEMLVHLKEHPHPNVIQVEEIVTNGFSVSLLLEDCRGGDLLQALNRKSIPVNAVEIMEKILLGLQHLHGLNIVHRDIKLQNILFMNTTSWECLKIADFGLACQKEKVSQFNPRCGTPGYTAPEVFDQTTIYNEKVDIYSAGVILYNILTFKNPFGNSKNPHDTIQRNMSGEYDKSHLIPIVNSQPLAYDLLTKMMEKNAHLRPSAAQCLQHPFFHKDKDQFDESVFNTLHINEADVSQKVKIQQPKIKQMPNNIKKIKKSPQ